MPWLWRGWALAATLLVDGFDRSSGLMSISYGIPCAAGGHTIQYGELSQANLESYLWSGQECGIGMSGLYDWPTSGTPDSIFFVVVADNGVDEDCDGWTGACDSDCPGPCVEVCGDGIVSAPIGEVCDDGNTAPADGCAADCSFDTSWCESYALCGDDEVQPGETRIRARACSPRGSFRSRAGRRSPCSSPDERTPGKT